MLKGKKALYILIPLNILIWSFFIYRFIEAYSDSDAPDPENSHLAIKISHLNDSAGYSLNLSYKDPFLKDVERPKNYRVAGTEQKAPVKVPAGPVKTSTIVARQLPDIRYLGLVKNSSSGAATALVSLNGQSKLVKVNDVIDGFTFKSFNRDSLVIKWEKEKIVVRK